MGGAGERRQRLTRQDVACWLLKSSLAPQSLLPGWAVGQERTVRRCLHRSYRLGLMLPGDPCVLWVSGRSGPGVHAVGRLVTAPAAADHVEQPAVDVALSLLPSPAARQQLAATPGFTDAEVLRIAAGSNPSYLTAGQVTALASRLRRHPAAQAIRPSTIWE